jgi:NAD+ kinase
LTECEPGDVAATVAEIVGGVCHVEPRTLLELSDILPDIDRAQGAPLALNEFALTRADGVRLPEFEVLVDGLRVDTYRADGFIVATPTGSTAYALSCGGPVLFPGIGGILLVPICSHSLHARPVVITDESAVTINAATPFPATVSADGQVVAQTDAFTSLTIKKSPTLAHFVRRQGTQFYARLLSKLATRRTDWQ